MPGKKKTLRVTFERSGGFAGITMKTAVEEDDLSLDEAQKLHQMVQEVDFFNLPEKITSQSPQPDRFQYELRLEESGRQHRVTVTEEGMPDKLKPLIKWLMERVRQATKGKKSY